MRVCVTMNFCNRMQHLLTIVRSLIILFSSIFRTFSLSYLIYTFKSPASESTWFFSLQLPCLFTINARKKEKTKMTKVENIAKQNTSQTYAVAVNKSFYLCFAILHVKFTFVSHSLSLSIQINLMCLVFQRNRKRKQFKFIKWLQISFSARAWKLLNILRVTYLLHAQLAAGAPYVTVRKHSNFYIVFNYLYILR